MAALELPTKPQTQRFRVTLGGREYQITQTWMPLDEIWVWDLADVSGNLILAGVPLVTGDDLLDQFPTIAVGGQLVVQTDHDTDARPTFQNLGSLSHVYFLPEAA